ncbi:MAG: hypothetical protein CTY25_03655 [Methylobacterium sp.]|nr:MAG: hypothetical protein CTY25_03655 [Methylobacterium sp.]
MIPETGPAMIEFTPLGRSGLVSWSRPGEFSCFDELLSAPIADTELLHLSHYGPIAIRYGAGPDVVLLLHSSLHQAPLLSPERRWLPPYAPMAIRALPFRRGAEPEEPEVALALATDGDARFALRGADGKPGPEFAMALDLLQRLGRGSARLANAAKLLIAADLLVPLYAPESHPDETLLTVSAERLRALGPRRVAALTADANLAFELAGAMLFSQRWLAKGVIQDVPAPETTPIPPAPRETFATYSPSDALDQPVLLDDSSLFSIDEFLQSGGLSK